MFLNLKEFQSAVKPVVILKVKMKKMTLNDQQNVNKDQCRALAS